jgi:hypothetical protein
MYANQNLNQIKLKTQKQNRVVESQNNWYRGSNTVHAEKKSQKLIQLEDNQKTKTFPICWQLQQIQQMEQKNHTKL